MNDVTVIIPIFNLDRDRLLNFRFVLDTLRLSLNLPVIVVEQTDGNLSPIAERCDALDAQYISIINDSNQIHKAELINFAVEQATTEYIWMNDADSFQNFKYIMREKWTHDFIQPFTISKKINKEQSRELRSGGEIEIHNSDDDDSDDQEINHNNITLFGALSFIARRKAFEDIGGMDESFIGWGFEDNEFCGRVFTTPTPPSFKVIKCIGLHLWHEPAHSWEHDAGNEWQEITARNQAYFESKFTPEDLQIIEKRVKVAHQPDPTMNIVTLFRGDFDYLENIYGYLRDEAFPCPVKITWVLNTPDPDFKKRATLLASEFPDVRIITNKETLELTDNYYDFRHEYVTQKYAQLLPTISDTFILTLEDDIVPQNGSLVKLFNSLFSDVDVGAAAGIYKSSVNPKLACCITKYAENSLEIENLRNYGIMDANRTGGGFTLWRTEAIETSFPIIFTRSSDTLVEGWDWYLSRKLIENEYRISLHTDIECGHLGNELIPSS